MGATIRDISLEDYDRLVEAAYGVALRSDGWDHLCTVLDEVLDTVYVSIHAHDVPSRLNTGVLSVKHAPEFIESYERHYSAVNPFLPGILTMEIGKSKASDELLDRATATNSEFYADWLKPQEDCLRGVGMVLERDKRRMLCLGAQIRGSDTDAVWNRVMELYDRIGPHVRQAFSVHRALRRQEWAAQAFCSVLDASGAAVFLLDGRGRLCDHNAAAEAMLSSSRMVFRDQFGNLCFHDRSASRRLAHGLRALQERQQDVCPEPIPIFSDDGREAQVAFLSPFVPDAEGPRFLKRFIAGDAPAVMLTVSRQQSGGALRATLLSELYGLTEAEATLAGLLRDGLTLRECADRRSVSIHTVRNQLRAIFEKTGTRRQPELLVLLSRL